MNHFKRQLVLAAAPAVVYKALSTQQGLRDWRTGSLQKLVETGAGTPYIDNTAEVCSR